MLWRVECLPVNRWTDRILSGVIRWERTRGWKKVGTYYNVSRVEERSWYINTAGTFPRSAF